MIRIIQMMVIIIQKIENWEVLNYFTEVLMKSTLEDDAGEIEKYIKDQEMSYPRPTCLIRDPSETDIPVETHP